ncbi:PREDICTED: peritrophin-48-like [Rhagoletis zephyria]|uniref:peritrophin-48-like n=1 Tax=Rhagoletis zephyria TaxID=28612 RepID=UPI000811A624|nr:PREDICTED: peritrophin-48-like [Rhagoletis zephyria]
MSIVLQYVVTLLAVTFWCSAIIPDGLTSLDTPDNSSMRACISKPYGYKVPDLTDCVGYLLCHGEMVIQQYCPPGQRFNTTLQSCQNGKCPPCNCDNGGGDGGAGIDCSTAPNGARFGDSQHCRVFWQCVEGEAVQLFCEIGMWYDRDRYVCNFPALVTNCPANED